MLLRRPFQEFCDFTSCTGFADVGNNSGVKSNGAQRQQQQHTASRLQALGQGCFGGVQPSSRASPSSLQSPSTTGCCPGLKMALAVLSLEAQTAAAQAKPKPCCWRRRRKNWCPSPSWCVSLSPCITAAFCWMMSEINHPPSLDRSSSRRGRFGRHKRVCRGIFPR